MRMPAFESRENVGTERGEPRVVSRAGKDGALKGEKATAAALKRLQELETLNLDR